MKALLEIYKDIFRKCENEKLSFCDESYMLYKAAEEYVENLHKNERWKYIIKYDIDLLKASSQMQRNLLNNSDKLDEKAVSIGERYILGIDSFLYTIYQEMERYGLSLDDVQETTQPSIVPDTEAENNASLNTGEVESNSNRNDMNSLPPEMKGIFRDTNDYISFINDCALLKKPKQIVSRLMDIPNLSLVKGNTDILYWHLRTKEIITIEYSYFCRLIRNENRA